MNDLKNFKMISEADDSYHIASPSGKSFTFDKDKLSDRAHEIIRSLKGMAEKSPQNFDDGGTALSSSAQDTPEQIVADASANAPAPAQPQSSGVSGSFGDDSVRAPAQATPEAQPMQSAAPQTMNPYAAEMAANTAKAQAEAQEASAESNINQQAFEQSQMAPTQQEVIAQNQAKSDALLKAYQSGKIDPDQYWQSHSKISAGIGMILGGIGAGMTHGANVPAQMLESAINRDIDSQKANQSKQMNLYQLNRQALGDDLSANLATQNQMYTGLKFKLQQAQSQFKGPIALANAQAANAMIGQKMAVNGAMMGMVRGQPGTEADWNSKLAMAKMYAPDMAKDIEARNIPGIGVAKVAPTPDDRAELMNYDSLGKGLDRALEFQKNVAGLGGAWTPTTRAEADDIKNNLVLSMGKLNDMKRPPSPEVMKLYNETIGNIGGVNLGGTAVKLQALKDQTESRKQSVLNGLGVTPFQGAAPSATAATKVVNGVTYRRGPNGEAIRVQ